MGGEHGGLAWLAAAGKKLPRLVRESSPTGQLVKRYAVVALSSIPPYSPARFPAPVERRWPATLALVLVLLAIKASLEEALMIRHFPEAYPEYRRRIKALIPGVW
jgi:hypothetical protein